MITLRQLNLCNPGELYQVQVLHNTLFPGMNASTAWMKWFFNDASKRAYGAFDGDLLIGLWCVEPKRLLLSDGRVSQVGRCFAVGIHPSYRRQNLFVELSQWAICVERDIAEFDYILGFPQHGRPVVGGHLKAGWQFVQSISLRALEPQPTDVCLAMCDTTRTFDFARARKNEVPGSFQETERELTKRWLKHPHNFYIILSAGIENYIVLKQYGDVMHVLDLHGSLKQANKLLRATSELACCHRARTVTMWCADNDPFVFEATEAGFRPIAEGSIDMLAVNVRERSPLVLPESHFQMGGEESY